MTGDGLNANSQFGTNKGIVIGGIDIDLSTVLSDVLDNIPLLGTLLSNALGGLNLLDISIPGINIALGGGDGGIGGGGGGGLILLDILNAGNMDGGIAVGAAIKSGDEFNGGNGSQLLDLGGLGINLGVNVAGGGGGGLTNGGDGFTIVNGLTDALTALGGGGGGSLGLDADDLGYATPGTTISVSAPTAAPGGSYTVAANSTLNIFGGSGAGGGVTADLDVLEPILDPVLGLLGLDGALSRLLEAEDGAGVTVAEIKQTGGTVNIIGGFGGGGGLASVNLLDTDENDLAISGGDGGGVTVTTATITGGGIFNVYGGAGGGANATASLGAAGGTGYGGTVNGGSMSDATSVLNIYSGADGGDVNSKLLGLLDVAVFDDTAKGGEGYGGTVNNFTVNGGTMNLYAGTSNGSNEAARYNAAGVDANGNLVYDADDHSMATAHNITNKGGTINLRGGRITGDYMQTAGKLVLAGGDFNIATNSKSNIYSGGEIVSEVEKTANGGKGEVLTGASFTGNVKAYATGSRYLTLETAKVSTGILDLASNVTLANASMSSGGIKIGGSSFITGSYNQTGGVLTLLNGNISQTKDPATELDLAATVSGGEIIADGGDSTLVGTLFKGDGGTTTREVLTSTLNGGALSLHEAIINGSNVSVTIGSGVTLDTGTLTAGRVVMDGGGLTGIYTQNGGTLDLKQTTVTGGAALTIAGGEIHAHVGNSTLRIGGGANDLFTITGTVLAKVADTGTLTLDGATVTGNLTTSGAVELANTKLSGDGIIHLVIGGQLAGAYVQNGGALYLEGGSVKSDAGSTASFLGGKIWAIDGNRTLDKAVFKGDVDLIANGSHTLALNGGTFETGAIVDIDGGVTLLNGVNNGGRITLSSADPANPYNTDGIGGSLMGTYTQSGGSLTVNGGTVDPKLAMTLNGGTVTANTDTVINSLTTNAASMDGPKAEAVLTNSDGADLTVNKTTVSQGRLTVGGSTLLTGETVVSGGTLRLIEDAVLDGTLKMSAGGTGTLWMNTNTIDGWQVDDGELIAGKLIVDFIEEGLLEINIAAGDNFTIEARNGNRYKLKGDIIGDEPGDTDITIEDGGDYEGDIHDGGKLTNNGGDADIGVIDGGEYEQNDGTSVIGELTGDGKITQNGGDTTLDLMSGGEYAMNGGITDIGTITGGDYTQTKGRSTIGELTGDGNVVQNGGDTTLGLMSGGSFAMNDGTVKIKDMTDGAFAMNGGTADVGAISGGAYMQTDGDTTLGELKGGIFAIADGSAEVGKMTGGTYRQTGGATALGSLDGGSYSMSAGTTELNGYSGGSYTQTGGDLKLGTNMKVATGSGDSITVSAGTVTNSSGKDYALSGWNITRKVVNGVAQAVELGGLNAESMIDVSGFTVSGRLNVRDFATVQDTSVSGGGEFILSGNADVRSIKLDTNGKLIFDGSRIVDGSVNMAGGAFAFESSAARDTAYLGYIEHVTGEGTFSFNSNSLNAGDLLILDDAEGTFMLDVGDISNIADQESIILLAQIGDGGSKATFKLANNGRIESGARIIQGSLKAESETVAHFVEGAAPAPEPGNGGEGEAAPAILAMAKAPVVAVSDEVMNHLNQEHIADNLQLQRLLLGPDAFGGGGVVLSETALGIGNAAAIGISQANVAMFELGRHFKALREATEQRWFDDAYRADTQADIWANAYTHYTTVETMGRATMRMWGLDIGADKMFNCFADGSLYLGAVAGGQWLSDFDIRQGYGSDGAGEGTAFSLGAYASYSNGNGWFGSLSARHIWSDIDMTSHTLGGNTSAYNPKRTMFSVAAEAGKRFDIGEAWFVEPSVGLAGTWMSGDAFRTSTGFDVRYDATTPVEGTAAVAFGYRGERFTPYAELALVHGFDGKTDVSFDGVDYASDPSGTRFRIGLGGSVALTEKLSLFLEAAYEKGSDFKDINGNVGINFSW